MAKRKKIPSLSQAKSSPAEAVRPAVVPAGRPVYACPDPVAKTRDFRGPALNLFLFLSIAVLLGWLLTALKIIFMPLFLAIFAAFLLDPAVRFLVSRRVPRPLSLLLVLAAAVFISWLFGLFTINTLVGFRDGITSYETRLQNILNEAKTFRELKLDFISPEQIRQAVSRVSFTGILGSTFTSLFNFLAYLTVTVLFSAYLLPGLNGLPDKIRQAFPGENGRELSRAFVTIGRQIQSYMWAKVLTSLITGALVTAACLMFKVDFAFTWGIFAALLNFVPNFGPVLSCAPPVLVCWLQYGGTAPWWLAGILALIMLVTGNVMEPKILGKSVNLSPVASLLALFFWGWLWGGIGMIIAVPATAIVKLTCDNIEYLKPLGQLLGNDPPPKPGG